jgi:type IV pilus assembly protein PilM
MASALLRFIQDPPPDYIFEVSEGGIAYMRPGMSQPGFEPLEPGVLSPSPISDNVLRPDALADKVRGLTRGGTGRKRGRAALILPDFSSRVAVLAFDAFPTDPKEQMSLVRFRMKRSVPFDLESAVVSFHAQGGKGKGTEIVVVAAALETIARYEAPFRAAGLHPGIVTTSAIAMIDLERKTDISVIARMSGAVLTVIVLHAGHLKLLRTVELADNSREEVLGVLLPTMAFVEDHFHAQPNRVLFCGMDDITGGDVVNHAADWETELGAPIEILRSRFGIPDRFNAGLHGYLQSRPDIAGASAA